MCVYVCVSACVYVCVCMCVCELKANKRIGDGGFWFVLLWSPTHFCGGFFGRERVLGPRDLRLKRSLTILS